MALSGTFQNYPVSSFGLYCEWSGVQSVTGNYTDITLNVYLSYYTLAVGARSDSTISINGVSETYTVPAIEDYSSGWKKKLLKTKTVRVSHNADGTKSGVALSASWRFSGTYSGVSVGTITASTTVTLNSIDRSAPTVSCSVSNITANGFKISASSSATADIWQYSLNGGSTWTQFSSTAGTSASVTLSTLLPNTTYSVRGTCEKAHQPGVWHIRTVSAKTLGGAVLLSCGSFSADAATVRPIPAGDGIQRRLYQLHHHQERLYDLPVPGGAHLVSGNSQQNHHPDFFGADNTPERYGKRQILHGDYRAGHQERKHPNRAAHPPVPAPSEPHRQIRGRASPASLSPTAIRPPPPSRTTTRCSSRIIPG